MIKKEFQMTKTKKDICGYETISELNIHVYILIHYAIKCHSPQ